ncbi:MAG: hypothetical protein QOH95_586 [Gaiellaceae bacterium]|nr:hypothetical protein [Gaiellaceae bacterium]
MHPCRSIGERVALLEPPGPAAFRLGRGYRIRRQALLGRREIRELDAERPTSATQTHARYSTIEGIMGGAARRA